MTVLHLVSDESLSFAEELALLQALVAPYSDILKPVPPSVQLNVVSHFANMVVSLEIADHFSIHRLARDFYRFLPPGMFVMLVHHSGLHRQYLMSQEPRQTREMEYTEKLLEKFSEVLPQYELVGTQVKTKADGRIDILAKDKASGRDVIIELKMGKENPARQLYGYAVDFDNPILVAINEDTVNSKSDNVTYLLFSELLEAA